MNYVGIATDKNDVSKSDPTMGPIYVAEKNGVQLALDMKVLISL